MPVPGASKNLTRYRHGQTVAHSRGDIRVRLVRWRHDTQVVAYRSLHVLEIAFALPVAVEINGAAGFQAQQARVEVIPLLLNVTTFMERTAAVDICLR